MSPVNLSPMCPVRTITPSVVPPAVATPEITTLTPAGITETSATLIGEVISTGTSSTSVTAYWGASDGGTTVASWANSIPLGVQSLGQVIAPISGLTVNTPYRVRFAATNASGTVWSPATITFTTAQTPPPARPDGLATTFTVGNVPLTWSAASGAASYIVRRGTVSGTYSTLASSITAANYTDSTAAGGTVYYYVVAAVGPGGTSDKSAEITGSPAVIPSAPSGLTVTQGYTYPEFRWTAVPFSASYTVKRATTSGGPFTTVASGITAPSYDDTTALNLSTYFWVVSATNIAGESANSSVVTLTLNVTNFVNFTAGNWNAVPWIPSPPGQPISSSTAELVFQNSSAIASSNNKGTFALNKLRFINQSVTLSGNALNFSGTAPTVTSGAPNVAHSIANAVTLSADTTFDIAANTLTVSGVISGANDLFKTSAGTLNLTGANTYTGHTYLSGGTLRYGAANSGVKTLFFGSTAGDTNASTLDMQANVTALALTTQTDVTAGENFGIIGAGKTLTIGGALTLGGLNSGTAENSHLTISGTGALVCNFGTNASVRRGSILDLNSLGSATFTGTNLNVGDIDNYTIANPSTLITPADGPTTLNVTSLNLDSATAGGGTSRGESATFLAPSGTGLLKIRGATGGTSRANLLLDKHAGSGTGTSIVTFDARGHACDILLTSLEIGRRSGTHAGGNGTTFFHFDSGTLDVINAVPIAFCEGAPSNTATVTLEGGNIAFTGGINLASHSGTTSTRHSTATLTIDGNAIITSGPITMAALTGTVATRNSIATLQLLGGSLTMTGHIQRGVATGTGTSTAVFSLKDGVLDMAGFSIGTTVNPLTTLTFEGGTMKNVGGINGGASLVKSGPDTLVLDGTNTYTGATLIEDGALAITGSLTSSITTSTATLAPQGNANTTGNVSVTSGAAYEVGVQSAQSDQLVVGGTVTLGGTLTIILSPGIAPGTDFTILSKTSAGAITGTFAGLPEGHVWQEQGYVWSITYTSGDGNDVVLHVATPSEEWRYANFASIANRGPGLDTADDDTDGVSNLMEYATAMNVALNDKLPQSATRNGSTLEFIYTKNKAATDVTFTVEWSNTLLNDWSATSVSAPTILSDNGVTQQIKVTVPAGGGVTKRFVHLKVTRP